MNVIQITVHCSGEKVGCYVCPHTDGRTCEVQETLKFVFPFHRFDIYDWIPIFAVLFVTALVLNTIFPNRS